MAAAETPPWLKEGVYFFELRTDPDTPGDIIPLALNPQRHEVGLPFTVRLSSTHDGGVVAEENGILMRPHRIAGTTGQARKVVVPGVSDVGSKHAIQEPSFRPRHIDVPALEIGPWGVEHFFLLEDLFQAYGDLKRDITTAAGVRLLWHNPHDFEHYWVIPEEFKMTRRSTLYFYDIAFTAIALAEITKGPSRPDNFLGTGPDLVSRTIDDEVGFGVWAPAVDPKADVKVWYEQALATYNQMVSDFNAAAKRISEIKSKIISFIRVAAKVAEFLRAVATFIRSAVDFIAHPLKALAGVLSEIDNALQETWAAIAGAPDEVRGALEQIAGNFQSLKRTVQAIGRHKDLFTPNPAVFGVGTSRSIDTTAAARAAAGRSFSDLVHGSTAPTSIDLTLERLGLHSPQSAALLRARYKSARGFSLRPGDSLWTLAERHLGEPARWSDIAALNALSPPYISDQGLPGTLKVGETILIPSTVAPSSGPTVAQVGGESVYLDRLFGTDLQIAEDDEDKTLYDFVIDVEGGSTDFKVVTGIDNLMQGLAVRAVNERGTILAAPNVGHAALKPVGREAIDVDIGRLRLGAAIEADPRIARVTKVERLPSSPDAVICDITAVPLGFDRPVTVRSKKLQLR